VQSDFAAYACHVWHLQKDLPEEQLAWSAIECTERFFYHTLWLPSKLSALGIDETYFEEMAATAVREGLANAYVSLDQEDVMAIYRACL